MIEITIGFPVFNVARYVEKSLLSALDQDFGYEYEILVIDDRGDDDSMSKILDLVKTHPKGSVIRIIQHDSNQGLGSSRNTIIENARGKFLFFLDSDDWITNDCLSSLHNLAIENGSQMVVGSYLEYDYQKKRICSEHIFEDLVIKRSAAGISLLSSDNNYQIAIWNKLFLTSFLKENRISCVHRFFEDVIPDALIRIYSNSVTISSKVTLYYNKRSQSITSQIYKNRGTDESANIYCDIVSRLKAIVKSNESVEGIYDLYFYKFLDCIYGLCQSDYTAKQKKYINKNIRSYRSVIPSYRVLKSKIHQRIYLVSIFRSKYEDIFFSMGCSKSMSPAYQVFYFPIKRWIWNLLH